MAEGRRFSLFGWVQSHIPTQETIGKYRLLRPFAKQLSRPDLWRLNHRSVPRGVALGLGVGIIIPFMHVVIAALLAIPARANIMFAALFTLVVNPLTIPPMYYLAYRIGRWELRQEAVVDLNDATNVSGELARFMFWIHHASKPIAVGILTLAAVSALLGYLFASIGWRWWVGSKLRERRHARRAARAG
ncbi:DUF2062 domain-containing protein [Sphingomonas sp. ASV193]|uniref:DUF2062 domain-containing protein n=1 Tax=Sphingomonas sp. ASV193 TaxID=3144405 RepID=UPI0032E87A81